MFEADHPEVFAAEDNGITPIEYLIVGLAHCLTAGVASPSRRTAGIQLRSVGRTVERHARHPSRSSVPTATCATAIQHQGDLPHRRGRVEEDVEALVAQSQKHSARVRHPDKPDERHRRSRPFLAGATGARSSSSRLPPSSSASARPRREPFLSDQSINHIMLERGEVGELPQRRERWTRSLSLPLAEPPAGLRRRPQPRRLHDDGGGDRVVERLAASPALPSGPVRRSRRCGLADGGCPRDDDARRDPLPGRGSWQQHLRPAVGVQLSPRRFRSPSSS